jgi:ABC-2 type transport system ATP-binding protein
MAGPTCTARALTKRFGTRVALDAVSFELAAGERIGIVGPNGAGKTTLLSILAGVLAPDSGELTLDAGAIGWVPQSPALYTKLSAAENLRLFARLEHVADVDRAVAQLLALTGLTTRAGEPVGRLSGGNRQRVNIAIGLLAQPAVLLLDEPSAGLDPRQRERLWEFLAALGTRGQPPSIVFSTHAISEVESHADRVLVLADGELLFTGTPAQLTAAVRVDTPDLELALLRYLDGHGHREQP